MNSVNGSGKIIAAALAVCILLICFSSCGSENAMPTADTTLQEETTSHAETASQNNDGQTASDTEHVSTEKAPESTVAAPETASQQETVSPETAKQTDPETSDETAASPSESKPEETQSENAMKILVLNGSPHPQGDTAKMVAVFRETAESAGHDVAVINVCRKNIKGCLACEYCHGKGQGVCVQKDDMQEIYAELKDTQMLVLASPIYYHGISGQLKCAVDRFYSALYPKAPETLKKAAMFLSSGDPDMYDGAKFSYDGDFLCYLGLEDVGIITNHDKDCLAAVRQMAASL
jgi:menaquinone-dependent protoporphyrinogen IX oxidase